MHTNTQPPPYRDVLNFLRRQPFGVEAFFERSLVLTYAVPATILAPLVGCGLELDTYDEWGFLAIAIVRTRHLRPRGFPIWTGRDFFLSGYRIFTRFPRPGKQTLRGLQILRSDTDRAAMVRFGNVFTRYNYRHAKVEMTDDGDRLELSIRTPNREADLHVVADLTSRPAPLPPGSPFRTMEDARKFAGPLPYTFTYDEKTKKMIVIKGVRKAWDPQPTKVEVREVTFLEHSPFAGADLRLANAFYVTDIPYAWRPGTLEEIA
ncbi:MAG: hypothetical protein EXR75_09330 [Myxococcales bacterium]|nr:hypothetical protein [Myxococcales bacterium]